MKLERLKQRAKEGSDVVLLVVGGGEVKGRIVRFEEAAVVLSQNGREREIFEAAIIGFELVPLAIEQKEGASSASSLALSSARPSKPQIGEKVGFIQLPTRSRPVNPPQADANQGADQKPDSEAAMLTWMAALTLLDSVRKALKASPTAHADARRAAHDLATSYTTAPLIVQRDSNIRYALIGAFRAIEYERKIELARDASSREAVELSNTLVEINAALRTPSGLRSEDRFSDLYHFLIAVRPHREQFEKDSHLWNELAESLREAYHVGIEFPNEPETAAIWEREPHRRQTHLRRMSEVCRSTLLFGFAAPDQKAKLEREAGGFAALADRHAAPQPPSEPAMGSIVSFGGSNFGFIQTRDARTLYFRLDDVFGAALRDALAEPGGTLEIQVDFDVEPQPTRRCDRAVRVRRPGFAPGSIKRLGTLKRADVGFIELSDGRLVHFPFSALPNPMTPPVLGAAVLCRPARAQLAHYTNRLRATQWTTSEIELLAEETPLQPVSSDAQRILADAALARDQGHISSAAQIYERGLRDYPVPQMVLSYAAMLKERDPRAAMRVYEEAVARDIFQTNYKIHEDAGVLAMHLRDYSRALDLLNHALALTQADPDHAGEKGVVLALARTHYRIGTEQSLQEASRLYKRIETLFGGSAAARIRLPRHILDNADAVEAALARMRAAYGKRGDVAFDFLERVGFKIVSAQIQHDERYADLVCKVEDRTLTKDFGLQDSLFLRCLLADRTQLDAPHYEEQLSKASTRDDGCDPHVGLVIAQSLSPSLVTQLRLRLRPRCGEKPIAIVPLSQADLESSRDPILTIRQTFGKWLYQRDLFQANSAVSGSDFFGRKRILAEIYDAILLGQPLGIFGLRKSGKTSVLWNVRERQHAEGSIVIYADLLKAEAVDLVFPWLYWTLANDLRKYAQRHLSPSFTWDLAGRFESHLRIGNFQAADAFFSDLNRVIEHTSNISPEERPKIVLMIDEVEGLLRKNGVQAFKFFGSLRGIHQNNQNGLAIVVTAANPSLAEAAQIEGQDNPVFRFFRQIYLPFLDFDECTEMVQELGKGMGVRFRDEACRRLSSETAGHPFLTRQICSVASDRPRPVMLGEQDISAAVKDYLDKGAAIDLPEILDRFQRDYPDEYALLLKMAAEPEERVAKNVLGGNSPQDKLKILHLLGYQILSEDRSDLIFKMAMMRSWLRRYQPTARRRDE